MARESRFSDMSVSYAPLLPETAARAAVERAVELAVERIAVLSAMLKRLGLWKISGGCSAIVDGAATMGAE